MELKKLSTREAMIWAMRYQFYLENRFYPAQAIRKATHDIIKLRETPEQMTEYDYDHNETIKDFYQKILEDEEEERGYGAQIRGALRKIRKDEELKKEQRVCDGPTILVDKD